MEREIGRSDGLHPSLVAGVRATIRESLAQPAAALVASGAGARARASAMLSPGAGRQANLSAGLLGGESAWRPPAPKIAPLADALNLTLKDLAVEPEARKGAASSATAALFGPPSASSSSTTATTAVAAAATAATTRWDAAEQRLAVRAASEMLLSGTPASTLGGGGVGGTRDSDAAGRAAPPAATCSECARAADRRCHECSEYQCGSCFAGLHKSGRRAGHLWTSALPPAPPAPPPSLPRALASDAEKALGDYVIRTGAPPGSAWRGVADTERFARGGSGAPASPDRGATTAGRLALSVHHTAQPVEPPATLRLAAPGPAAFAAMRRAWRASDGGEKTPQASYDVARAADAAAQSRRVQGGGRPSAAASVVTSADAAAAKSALLEGRGAYVAEAHNTPGLSPGSARAATRDRLAARAALSEDAFLQRARMHESLSVTRRK